MYAYGKRGANVTDNSRARVSLSARRAGTGPLSKRNKLPGDDDDDDDHIIREELPAPTSPSSAPCCIYYYYYYSFLRVMRDDYIIVLIFIYIRDVIKKKKTRIYIFRGLGESYCRFRLYNDYAGVHAPEI